MSNYSNLLRRAQMVQLQEIYDRQTINNSNDNNDDGSDSAMDLSAGCQDQWAYTYSHTSKKQKLSDDSAKNDIFNDNDNRGGGRGGNNNNNNNNNNDDGSNSAMDLSDACWGQWDYTYSRTSKKQKLSDDSAKNEIFNGNDFNRFTAVLISLICGNTYFNGSWDGIVQLSHWMKSANYQMTNKNQQQLLTWQIKQTLELEPDESNQFSMPCLRNNDEVILCVAAYIDLPITQQKSTELERQIKSHCIFLANETDETTKQQLIDCRFFADNFLESARCIFQICDQQLFIAISDNTVRCISIERGSNVKSVLISLSNAVWRMKQYRFECKARALTGSASGAADGNTHLLLYGISRCVAQYIPSDIIRLCAQYCGEMCSVSIRLRIPFTAHCTQVLTVKKSLQISGNIYGKHFGPTGGIYDVSMRGRLVLDWSVEERVADLIDGCRDIVQTEQTLQQQQTDKIRLQRKPFLSRHRRCHHLKSANRDEFVELILKILRNGEEIQDIERKNMLRLHFPQHTLLVDLDGIMPIDFDIECKSGLFFVLDAFFASLCFADCNAYICKYETYDSFFQIIASSFLECDYAFNLKTIIVQLSTKLNTEMEARSKICWIHFISNCCLEIEKQKNRFNDEINGWDSTLFNYLFDLLLQCICCMEYDALFTAPETFITDYILTFFITFHEHNAYSLFKRDLNSDILAPGIIKSQYLMTRFKHYGGTHGKPLTLLWCKMLESAKGAEKQQLIRVILSAQIQAVEPELESTITGMILCQKMDDKQLFAMVTDESALQNKINEALAVLKFLQQQKLSGNKCV